VATERLALSGHVAELVENHYRHCKPILVVGTARTLLDAILDLASGVDGAEDPSGVLSFDADDADEALRALVAAMSKHRHYTRETDPPTI
jgi:catalase